MKELSTLSLHEELLGGWTAFFCLFSSSFNEIIKQIVCVGKSIHTITHSFFNCHSSRSLPYTRHSRTNELRMRCQKREKKAFSTFPTVFFFLLKTAERKVLAQIYRKFSPIQCGAFFFSWAFWCGEEVQMCVHTKGLIHDFFLSRLKRRFEANFPFWESAIYLSAIRTFSKQL